MSDNSVSLNSFPSSDIQALAMLYTENQNLKEKSVKEIAEIYFNAYYELTYKHRDLRDDIRKNFKDGK